MNECRNGFRVDNFVLFTSHHFVLLKGEAWLHTLSTFKQYVGWSEVVFFIAIITILIGLFYSIDKPSEECPLMSCVTNYFHRHNVNILKTILNRLARSVSFLSVSQIGTQKKKHTHIISSILKSIQTTSKKSIINFLVLSMTLSSIELPNLVICSSYPMAIDSSSFTLYYRLFSVMPDWRNEKKSKLQNYSEPVDAGQQSTVYRVFFLHFFSNITRKQCTHDSSELSGDHLINYRSFIDSRNPVSFDPIHCQWKKSRIA